MVYEKDTQSGRTQGQPPRRPPPPRYGPRPRDVPTELGQRLQALRVQRGLTQVQLAQRAGVSQTVIARLEAGKRSGRLETWVRLAAALGVTLDELVGGEAQTPSEQENNSPRA